MVSSALRAMRAASGPAGSGSSGNVAFHAIGTYTQKATASTWSAIPLPTFTVGDMLLLCCGLNVTATPTPTNPTGWALVGSVPGHTADGATFVWAKIAVTSEPAPSIPWGASLSGSAVILSYGGVASVDPTVQPNQQTTVGTSLTIAGFSPSSKGPRNGCAILAASVRNASSTVGQFGVSTGYTSRTLGPASPAPGTLTVQELEVIGAAVSAVTVTNSTNSGGGNYLNGLSFFLDST